MSVPHERIAADFPAPLTDEQRCALRAYDAVLALKTEHAGHQAVKCEAEATHTESWEALLAGQLRQLDLAPSPSERAPLDAAADRDRAADSAPSEEALAPAEGDARPRKKFKISHGNGAFAHLTTLLRQTQQEARDDAALRRRREDITAASHRQQLEYELADAVRRRVGAEEKHRQMQTEVAELARARPVYRALMDRLDHVEAEYAASFFLRAAGEPTSSHEIFFCPRYHTVETQSIVLSQVEGAVDAYQRFREELEPFLEAAEAAAVAGPARPAGSDACASGDARGAGRDFSSSV